MGAGCGAATARTLAARGKPSRTSDPRGRPAPSASRGDEPLAAGGRAIAPSGGRAQSRRGDRAPFGASAPSRTSASLAAAPAPSASQSDPPPFAPRDEDVASKRGRRRKHRHGRISDVEFAQPPRRDGEFTTRRADPLLAQRGNAELADSHRGNRQLTAAGCTTHGGGWAPTHVKPRSSPVGLVVVLRPGITNSHRRTANSPRWIARLTVGAPRAHVPTRLHRLAQPHESPTRTGEIANSPRSNVRLTRRWGSGSSARRCAPGPRPSRTRPRSDPFAGRAPPSRGCRSGQTAVRPGLAGRAPASGDV